MLYKWQQEYQDWLNEPCEVYTGSPKQRQTALDNWTHGLIITYDTLKRINHFLKQTEEEKEANKPKEFSHTTGAIDIIRKYKPVKMLVDEFHRAKGFATARAHALNLLAKDVQYRCILTGTPAYSTQLDVFNMLKFLWPEHPDFKSWWIFRQKYVKHKSIWVKRGGTATQQQVPVALNPIGIKLIHNLFEKYCVQHKRKDPDVMPWLPDEPVPELIYLPCDNVQKKYLKELEEWFETEDETIIAKNGLDRITKYRQILSEPAILTGKATWGPKSNWVLEYMEEYKDTPTIYFTNSTKHIRLIVHTMNQIAPTKCIIGDTPMYVRQEYASQFQNGVFKHLICNTQAAQEGLTLDRAECIVFIEQFPPYGSIEQAAQRFTATTPEMAEIPKRIIKLIMRDTYDEVIRKLIDSRKENVNVLNDFQKFIRR